MEGAQLKEKARLSPAYIQQPGFPMGQLVLPSLESDKFGNKRHNTNERNENEQTPICFGSSGG